jgi:hypothetical protein
LVLGAGCIIIGAGVAVSGVYAGWGDSHALTTGQLNAATVTSSFSDTGTNTWDTDVDKIVAGDHFFRYADLTNTGDVSQAFAATVAGSGGLVTAGGLQIAIKACDGDGASWDQTDGTCTDGTETTLLAPVDVASAGTANPLGSLEPTAARHLQFEISLPSSASSSLYGAGGTVTVTSVGAAASGDRTAG